MISTAPPAEPAAIQKIPAPRGESSLPRLGVLELIPRLNASLVMVFACLVLVSWQLGIEVLQRFATAFPRMNPLTAVDFVAASLALWLLLPERTSRIRLRCGQVLSILVIVAGCLKLIGNWWMWHPGIDEILFHASVDQIPSAPALMAPGTALAFILVAASLLLLDRETSRGSRPAQFVVFVAGALAVIDVTGYAYGGKAFLGYRLYRTMALPTALSFLLLAVGILVARPRNGFMAICFGKGTGAIVVRRLLPLAVAAPIALGWIRILGESAGWFSREAGVAFTSAAYIIVLSIIVLWTAHALQLIDDEREAARKSLQRSEELYRLRSVELEAANKEMEAFSYSVSHDLRSPLRAIDGFSRILRDDLGDRISDEAKNCLVRICAAAERMGVLIDDLLNLSRITRTGIRREAVDLSLLAGAIAGNLRASDPQREVEFLISPGLRVHADAGLMRIVLENLLGNSWKFTAKRPQARIEFATAELDGKAMFLVRDNGAGFDQSHAGKLFGAFNRLHGATEFPGTGIGLATVHRIIQRHGGEIRGEGAVGRGATFYFTL